MRLFIHRPTAETATVPGHPLSWLFGAWFLMAQVHAHAQETFSRAYTFAGVGGVVEVPGSGGFLLCQTERYDLGDIDGFSFWRLDADGSLDTAHYYSTGPLYNVMQGGAFPMVRSDGTYSFLFGNHPSLSFKSSIRVFNTTADGVMNWNRKIEFGSPDMGVYMIGQSFFEAPDAGYVIQGIRTYQPNSLINFRGPVVIKLDGSGNILWNKSYDVTEICPSKSICAVDPSGEILLGFNSHHECSDEILDSYITKIAADGTTLWSKRIAGLQGGMADCVRYDDGYLIVTNDSTVYGLVRINGSGDVLWSRSYRLSYGQFWASQRVDARGTSDGGAVLFSGVDPIPMVTLNDLTMVKVDAAGSVLWKAFFHDASIQLSGDILETNNGSLLQLSWASLSDNWTERVFLRKITSDGFSPCAVEGGPELIEAALDLEVSDFTLSEFDTLMLSAPLYVNDTTSWEILQWLPTCDMMGFVGVDEADAEWRISISPNPFTATAVIDLGREIGNAELLVYDARGVQALQVKLNSRRSIISRTGLADGLYLYRVISNGVVLGNGKFIVE